MTLIDQLRRWWNPAQWRDDHPEVSDGKPQAHDDPSQVRVNVEGGGWRVFPGLAPDEADKLAAEIANEKRESAEE